MFLWKKALPLLTRIRPSVEPEELQIQNDLPAFRLSVRVWPFSSKVVAV